MVRSIAGVAALARTFAQLQRTASTGQLNLERDGEPWHYYFANGRLLFAWGGRHRVRRWQRAIAAHCPHWRFDPRATRTGLWEYKLLHRAVTHDQLDGFQAKAVVTAIVREVLFATFDSTELTARWQSPPAGKSEGDRDLPVTLNPQEFDRLFRSVVDMWQQWQGMGLGYICPDDAPLWTGDHATDSQLSATAQSVRRLFNGQQTLWDVAQQQQRSLVYLTRTLHHFVQQGSLQLRSVLDVPAPFEQLQMVAAAVQPPARTIACIDDSPTVSAYLRNILEPEGFRVLAVQNPLQDLPQLLEQQPELIFLDLNMPSIHGCDFCNFLRKTSVFQATPIVILTGNNGAIDRVRANLSGASDFLSKPPQRDRLLEVVRHHLDRAPRNLSSVNTPPSLNYPTSRA